MDTQFQQEIVKRKAKTQIPIPDTRLVNGEVYMLYCESPTKKVAERAGASFKVGKYAITETPEGFFAVYILLPGTKLALQAKYRINEGG